MDLMYPCEAEVFRAEIRGWRGADPPAGWGEPGFEMSPHGRERFDTGWTEKLRRLGERVLGLAKEPKSASA